MKVYIASPQKEASRGTGMKKDITKKEEGRAGIAQKSPIRDLLSFRDTVDDWLSDIFEGRNSLLSSAVKVDWNPQVDIKETDKELVLSASLPGVKKDDLNVEINENLLTIRGERKEEEEEKTEDYIRKEQFYGSFARSFRLPENVNAEQIKGDFKNGVLEIRMQKTGELPPKAKKIPIE